MEPNGYVKERIRELARVSFQRDTVTFSDFLSLAEQDEALSFAGRGSGVSAAFFGGYEGAERQICAFYPPGLTPQAYPIRCLYVEAKAKRFAEELSHRDFLGAILHLGVERDMIGDILVEEAGAYVFCREQMADFLIDSLERVRHTAMKVTLVEDPEDLPKPKIEPVRGTVASVRLDSLLALAFQKSRSSLATDPQAGLVYVNGRQVFSGAFVPKEGDVISLRGTGRFVLLEVEGQTKKGRIAVQLGRYV